MAPLLIKLVMHFHSYYHRCLSADHFILDIIIYTYYYIYTVITSLSILYEFGTRECSLVEF